MIDRPSSLRGARSDNQMVSEAQCRAQLHLHRKFRRTARRGTALHASVIRAWVYPNEAIPQLSPEPLLPNQRARDAAGMRAATYLRVR